MSLHEEIFESDYTFSVDKIADVSASEILLSDWKLLVSGKGPVAARVAVGDPVGGNDSRHIQQVICYTPPMLEATIGRAREEKRILKEAVTEMMTEGFSAKFARIMVAAYRQRIWNVRFDTFGRKIKKKKVAKTI